MIFQYIKNEQSKNQTFNFDENKAKLYMVLLLDIKWYYKPWSTLF